MSIERYFAVKMGRRPGIYPSLEIARRDGIVDHPNALWRSFRSIDGAVNYLREVIPQGSLDSQGDNVLEGSHSTDLLSSSPTSLVPPLSPPPSSAPPLSAPPPYYPTELESNNHVEAGLSSFVAANRLVHADSIPPGREREYQQDSILSSYYHPASQESGMPNSTLDDDERQASTASTDLNSAVSTENPFPDREEDHNVVENAPGPDPGNSVFNPYHTDVNAHNGGPLTLETGAVSLFLGRKRHPHEHFVFRLRGAPEDVEVDMEAVHAVVGQGTYNYMLCHYFTRGSMHVVAASYYHNQNDLAAFSAALEPRGLASRVVTYLWYLISLHSNGHSDREDSQGTSDGGAEGELAAEADAVEAGTDD